MQSNALRQLVLPLFAAFIWGSAFVSQSLGAEYLRPFAFNAARTAVGAAALFVVILIFRKISPPAAKSPEEKRLARRDLLTGGICCGTLLALAMNLQQFGIETSTVGKAGFITTLYIVLVPLFGLFRHRHASARLWCSIAVALVGLYFLCFEGSTEQLTLSKGDIYLLLCAFGFTAQMLTVEHFVQRVDGVCLSCLQMLVASLISWGFTLAFERCDVSMYLAAMPSILYAGIFSSGIAYTLQIIAQKDTDTAVVSLLMSTESVFAVFCGAVFLHERLSNWEYLGCALMLIAVILSQLPERKGKLPKRREAIP